MEKNDIERLAFKKLINQSDLGNNDLSVQARLVGEVRRLLDGIKLKDLIIPEHLFEELMELQTETRLSVPEMVSIALRRYIDSVKSNDKGIWVDGVRYPVPKQMP
jgi:hypothetical protein